MPKEIVRNASEHDQEFHAQVRWNRGAYCQIATVKTDETYAVHGEVEGFFVDLDRDGLNRLIRVLRKARDQAFGSDA